MIPKRPFLPLLGVVSGLLLAGCGGGGGGGTTTTTAQATTTQSALPTPTKPPTKLGKAAYVARMQQLGKELDLDLHRLYPLAYRPGGSAAAADTAHSIEAARRAVLGIETDLEEITPPAPIAADHRRLEASLQNISTELDQLLASLRSSDADTFGQLSSLPALAGVQQATRAMEDKGYDVIRDSG